VDVIFRSKKLKKCYLESRLAVRTWGYEVARKYIERIDIIQEARNLNELRQLPGLNCHPLKGKREGQYAVSLTGFWRLIFTLHGEHLEIVQIEEVSKHYGD
jgi:proteic killer suppression protein